MGSSERRPGLEIARRALAGSNARKAQGGPGLMAGLIVALDHSSREEALGIV
jgi:hypothetical protein